jgi:HEPN domain-containing protein
VSQVPLLVPTYYHCEQAIEKILKAYIIAKENILTKTHDLNELRRICETHSPDFSGFEDICDEISAYSAIRYPPNINLTIRQMRKTIKDTFEIVDFTKSKLKDLGYEVPESSTTAAMEEVKEAIRVLRQQKSGAVGCG